MDQVVTEKVPLTVLAPIVDKKGAFEHVPEQYMRAGFARVRVDGVVYALDEFPTLDKNYKHTIDVVVDRLVVATQKCRPAKPIVEQTLDLADGR